jgi:hypothetical protein
MENIKKTKFDNILETNQGDAFLSQEEQYHVNVFKKESEFISHINPFFNEVLQRFNLVFVHSGSNKWLPQSDSSKHTDLKPDGQRKLSNSNTDLKPDGFVTHHGMFYAKVSPNRNLTLNGCIWSNGTVFSSFSSQRISNCNSV